MKEIFNYPEEEMEKCMVSTEPKIAVFIDNRSASVCFDFGEETVAMGVNEKEVITREVKFCTRIRPPFLLSKSAFHPVRALRSKPYHRYVQ